MYYDIKDNIYSNEPPKNSVSSVNSKIFSNFTNEDDYFIESSYINEDLNNVLKPNNINVDNLAIKPFIEYDEKNIRNPQYITYIDHPNIILDSKEEKEETKEKEEKDEEELKNLNMISKVYFGSITIIGLYIFFKLLQRSR